MRNNNLVNNNTRAVEKSLSRQKDNDDLASGSKTREQLRKENGVFAQLGAKPNFIEFLNRPK